MMLLNIALVIFYGILILYYSINFKIPLFTEMKSAEISFSIIIPFRNEEKHLPQLLDCLKNLKYPSNLFEIILVDDQSEDNSKTICKAWKAENTTLHVKVLDNKNLAKSPKKSAILTALKQAKHSHVLTTDADCMLPEEWLSTFNDYLQHNPSDLVAAPVKLIEDARFWTKFQVLDMMSLQVIGLGSFDTPLPLFCNAANLCYKAQTLKDINAFNTHKDIISGDDVFNLEAFQKHDKTINALIHEQATVWTKAEDNFQNLTQQRVRWASKAKFYTNNQLKLLGIVVFLTNLILVLSLILTPTFGSLLQFWWLLWILKLAFDFYVLKIGNQFFKTNLCLREYLIMLVVYPFISSYFAIRSLIGKFEWKGRYFDV